jgi:phospholipid transport system substrate-binding protein
MARHCLTYSNSKGFIMKHFLFVCIFILLINQIALADDIDNVEQLLKTKLDAVLEVLQKKDIELEARKKEIVNIVTPLFDFSLMAKLALGKRHWSGLKENEKEEFIILFTKLLKTSYLEKLTLYTNETLSYEMPVQKRNKIHIPTVLATKGNKISMLYKHYRSKQGWKLYDIEIQGISIISTYRSQFNQTLSKGTISDLMMKLKTPGQQ